MFCSALRPLLLSYKESGKTCLEAFDEIESEFQKVMRMHMKKMWAAKLGLVLKDGVDDFDYELFSELQKLMIQTPVDYTMFFRELSSIPDDIEPLKKSFL